MSFNYVCANYSFASRPNSYIPSIEADTTSLFSDKAVIGAMCPAAAKFAISTEPQKVIGGHAAIADNSLLSARDLADMQEAKDNGFDIEVIHMSDYETEHGPRIFDELDSDLDFAPNMVSGVEFVSGDASISLREQDKSEVLLPVCGFDFLDPLDRPLSTVKCQVKFSCPLNDNVTLITPDQALNHVHYKGVDLQHYIRSMVKLLGVCLASIDTNKYDAGIEFDLFQWRSLGKAVEDIFYNLSLDFNDVWFTPAQLAYAAQKADNEVLMAIAKGLLVAKVKVYWFPRKQ